jgi:type IV pilus assembly protein PilO
VLFKPEKEKPLDFYAELPVSIKVTGSYHELAEFVSDVAALPRIVTVGNLSITADKGGRLSMTATAKTYRYLEAEELNIQRKAPGKRPAKAPAKAGG